MTEGVTAWLREDDTVVEAVKEGVAEADWLWLAVRLNDRLCDSVALWLGVASCEAVFCVKRQGMKICCNMFNILYLNSQLGLT